MGGTAPCARGDRNCVHTFSPPGRFGPMMRGTSHRCALGRSQLACKQPPRIISLYIFCSSQTHTCVVRLSPSWYRRGLQRTCGQHPARVCRAPRGRPRPPQTAAFNKQGLVTATYTLDTDADSDCDVSHSRIQAPQLYSTLNAYGAPPAPAPLQTHLYRAACTELSSSLYRSAFRRQA